LTRMFSGSDDVLPPMADKGCSHVYYLWPAQVAAGKRQRFLRKLWDCNFPMRKGYSPVLNRVFDAGYSCPVAESLEDHTLITFEVCSYNPDLWQRRKMHTIAQWAMETIDR